jgi:hypothetical protein
MMKKVIVQDNIIISKAANGWAVQMPRQIENPSGGMGESLSDMMSGIMPMVKEIFKEKEKDPLLSRMQEENEYAEPAQKTEEPVPVIGEDPYLFIFERFSDILGFLASKFRDFD